jgi:hypothetical protein
VLRLLICDLVGEDVTRASIATLGADLAERSDVSDRSARRHGDEPVRRPSASRPADTRHRKSRPGSVRGELSGSGTSGRRFGRILVSALETSACTRSSIAA